MAYTAMKTWATGDKLPATDLNTYLRDNMTELEARIQFTFAEYDPPSNYSRTNATDTGWTAIDATNLALSFTKRLGATESFMVIGWQGAMSLSDPAGNQTSEWGIRVEAVNNFDEAFGFFTSPQGTSGKYVASTVLRVEDNLSPGTRTIYPIWRNNTTASYTQILAGNRAIRMFTIELPK